MEKSNIKYQISNIENQESNLRFTHFVDIPSCDCTIGTARRSDNNRTKLFLIINHKGSIYTRNGLNDTWVELACSDSQQIRSLVEQVVDGGAPRYSTNHAALN